MIRSKRTLRIKQGNGFDPATDTMISSLSVPSSLPKLEAIFMAFCGPTALGNRAGTRKETRFQDPIDIERSPTACFASTKAQLWRWSAAAPPFPFKSKVDPALIYGLIWP